MNPRFNLRLWVVVATLATVLIVHAVLALSLTRYVSGQMIAREGIVAQEFLNSILKAEGTADILLQPSGSAALGSFSHHVVSLPGLLRTNIYGLDRVIRFSTDAGLVGTIPEEEDDLELALAGQISTSLNSEVGDTPEAKLSKFFIGGESVIESYMPLTNAGGQVVGVVEYYRDAATLQQFLSNVAGIVWVAAVVSGAVITVSLYGAAARASRKIDAQTRELQSLSVMASLGQMSAAVTHSLRNPLASIRSSIDLLQLSKPGLADDTVADITSEINRIDRHVQDLLDFAGSDHTEAQPCDLAAVVGGAIARLQNRADRSAVRFNLQLGDNRTKVLASVPLLLQVLENILTNGIEAMPQGGTITLTAQSDARQVRLQIADQGTGFAPDLVGKVPIAFVTTKQRGLGLGLSISQKLLARFGAILQIANGPSGGAQVTLLFKRA